ncbi:MAG: helix-turn-helix transcriptional regulator [Bacteroidales bacterium]|nr:helix-turn-helix transcriptional regulator [Bacteroidales bacterium]
MKHVNDKQIRDYDAVLDAKYGAPGTPERTQFEEEAYSFYSGQIIRDIRKEAGVTQSELADKIGADKSYVSRVERGEIMPSVGTFYRIIAALGFRVQLTNQ